MRSSLMSQTLRQQVTMALMRFWKRHSSMYTQCNQIPFIWRWTHVSYTYVQLISEVQMLLQCCFAVQNPSQSCERNIVVNSTQSTSNIPWLWYVFQPCLSSAGPRKLLKTGCATDRLMLWKHCYHSVFSSSCFSVHRWLA